MKSIALALSALLLGLNASADRIMLLGSNMDSLRARFDYIQHAQNEIKFQYYIITNDQLGLTTLSLLRDAANRGVKVKILVDSMNNDMTGPTMAALLLNLHPGAQANLEIKEYNSFNLFSPGKYTKRMHDKSLIIDGKAMVTGGRNIEDGYFGLPSTGKKTLSIFEDSDALVLDSNAIDISGQYFDDLWNSRFVNEARLNDFSMASLRRLTNCATGPRANDGQCEAKRLENVRRVSNEESRINQIISDYKNKQNIEQYIPLDWAADTVDVAPIEYLYDDVKTQARNLKKPELNIGTQLYGIVGQATKSVTIVTPYLIITPQQEALFKALKEKDVKVRIITNSKAANDTVPAEVGYEKTRQLALNQNVEVLEYQGPDTLHAKMVLIDDATLFIGSFNWDFRSQNLNREVGLVVQLPEDRANTFRTDVYYKFARIMRNTCKVNGDACEVVSNVQLSELTQRDRDRLAALSLKRASREKGFYDFLYPLIKKQL
jgi:cardiolipin synthase C